MKKSMVCALIVTSAAAASVSADVTTYFGQDFTSNEAVRPTRVNSAAAQTDFLANFTTVSTEDFESFTDNAAAPITLTFGTGTATLNGNGYIADVPTGTGGGLGTHPTSGDKFWLTYVGEDFVVTFDSPQNAFGFYATDLGDIGSQLSLRFDNDPSRDVIVPHAVGNTSISGNVFYFGLIDTQGFSSVAFITATGTPGDGFGFDDMTIGNQSVLSVPAPAALPAGLGLLTLAATRRRPTRG